MKSSNSAEEKGSDKRGKMDASVADVVVVVVSNQLLALANNITQTDRLSHKGDKKTCVRVDETHKHGYDMSLRQKENRID